MKHSQKGIGLRSIGVVFSEHKTPEGTPIQPAYAEQFEGRVVVDSEFALALEDIEGFERIWLIYHLDRSRGFEPKVVPYRDNREHGVFATRSPSRANAIGMSVVKLLGRDENTLRVGALDILDGTPLLDIKPYVPEFDAYPDSKAGWLDERRQDCTVADTRFHI